MDDGGEVSPDYDGRKYGLPAKSVDPSQTCTEKPCIKNCDLIKILSVFAQQAQVVVYLKRDLYLQRRSCSYFFSLCITL